MIPCGISWDAPWHGRVWLANERSAAQSLPPGMVLPQLVPGGPGRAGGGEELPSAASPLAMGRGMGAAAAPLPPASAHRSYTG